MAALAETMMPPVVAVLVGEPAVKDGDGLLFGRVEVRLLPVVYTSVGHEDDWASKGIQESLYISKPFVGAQLVVAVAGLINAASSHPPQP